MSKRIQQPSRSRPIDTSKTNLITCVNGLHWSAPKSIMSTTIAHVCYLHNTLYAVDDTGKLVLATSELLEYFKDKKIIQLDKWQQDKTFLATDTELYSANGNEVESIYKVENNDFIRELTCGAQHGFFKTQRHVFSFGSNQYGQRTEPSKDRAHGYTLAKDLFVTDELYAGGWVTFVRRDGLFYGCGYNEDGRLGDGGNKHYYKLTQLNHHRLGIYTLACGGWHTLGLTHSGNVYIWGMNLDGCIPDLQSYSTLSTPRLLWSVGDVINIFSGTYAASSFMQLRNGDMYGFGKNVSDSVFGPIGVIIVDKPTKIEALANIPVRQIFVNFIGAVVLIETRVKTHTIKRVDKFVDVLAYF